MAYVHGYSASESARLGDQASTLTDLLHADTSYPAASRVLEAGCGVGAQTVILAVRSPAAAFTSIDVSTESLAQAELRVGEAGLANVTLQRADILDLPLGPEQFDHVFLCFVLEHLPDPAAALQAVWEVLTPGGSITVIEGDHGSAYVLTYTSAPLDRDVEVVGEVSAEIWSQSSTPFADVFVRLCDVDARGRSRNVCDGLTSLTGADQVTCASVRLWPTAHRFLAGHRIRIQVCSGAFPRYARGGVGMWTSRQTRVEGRARVDRAAGLRRGPAARRRITREG